MSIVEVVGRLDSNFAWDGNAILEDGDLAIGKPFPGELRGAFVAVMSDGNDRWRVLRDPLGLNKLFWVAGADGTIAIAARPHTLTQAGWSFDQIWAVPRGAVFELGGEDSDDEGQSMWPQPWSTAATDESTDLERIATKIRDRISGYLEAIAAAHRGSSVFVCLSGGLDSSGIAAMAREHFPDVTAVTFDLARPGDEASDDRAAAKRVARDLSLPFLEVVATDDELLAMLDVVLVAGIDWRDFNVHAGLVNAVLAEAIQEATATGHQDETSIVLTGDLANAFLVDYHAEEYRGTPYYELPSLPPGRLRTSLVQGLDTCHREIGVFAAWGLPVVQPFSAATREYLALPESLLTLADRKQEVSRLIFGQRLPAYVYSRPKVRAQMGSAQPGHGVLAACAGRGVSAAPLRRRFAELHQADDKALDRFIRAGRYRARKPGPASNGAGDPPGCPRTGRAQQ